ncbi:hypothetical protein J7L68_05040 [bacterium]|nr:hypothetical protein [bacterium]
MSKKKKVRPVSVMEVQKLPPEKVEELFEDLNDGKIALISIYPDRWAQIGLHSPTLKRFIARKQGLQISSIAKMMKILSKEWLDEDAKRISQQTKSKNSKTLQTTSKTGICGKKML